MGFNLYKFIPMKPGRLFRQALAFFLISLLISPAALAQDRRGLFLQEMQGGGAQDNTTSFGEVGGPGGGAFGGTDELDQQEMMMGRRGQMGTQLVYFIHVLGEVKSPGTYKVTPSMRVTDALKKAGGILGNGSERFIDLRKAGQSKGRILDLFAYKTLGNLAMNPYLQDNDTIFVPLKQRAVEIEGPVRRPGIYELKNERTLDDVVQLAGGFTVGANRNDTVKVVRYKQGKEKDVIEIPDNTQEMRSFHVEDGDVIIVQHKFLTENTFDYNVKKLPNDNMFVPAYVDKVFVIGGVKAPGAIPFNQYYSVRQYLTLAGGSTIMAKNGKINVIRVDGSKVKAPNGEFSGVVNPGDTIVVPEKSVPTEFYYSLMTTIASVGLSAAALFR
jgi:protein involved in polysaccharide export with SLBB domain